jgi:hypothetical protein
MQITLLILNLAAIISAVIWLISKPDWEPLVTTIGLLIGLIVQLFSNNSGGGAKMKQKGGKRSTNYQAGGDITIHR